MPYIKKNLRHGLDTGLVPQSAGELNYILTRAALDYIKAHGQSYKVFNDVVGAFECAKHELIRRLVNNYEDTKIRENGDVYES